jgi:hypothetical protein
MRTTKGEIMFDTVLQTYDDGSELRTKDLMASVGVGIVLAAIGIACVIKFDAWRERRIMKKYNIEPNNM